MLNNKTSTIEQHPLIDEHGKNVDFLVEDWGEVHEYSYDYLKAHRHNFYEIMVFQKGKAIHDIDFNTLVAKASEIHFVAPDNVHLLVREKNSKGLSLQFTGSQVNKQLIENLPFNSPFPKISLKASELSKILYHVSQIKFEKQRKNKASDALIRSYFEVILLLLLQNSNEGIKEGSYKPSSPYIDSFKKLIKEHHIKHYTVEDYADLLHISTKHLIEICKKQTGKTPLKLIQEFIISEAKRKLFYTQRSIKDIAYSLGFDEPANFSKYFKSATGYSPLTYKEDVGK
jgi:AraC family transcriptional regulator, transcriptional activator of pobA